MIKNILIALALLLTGVAIGYYAMPAKVVEKEVTKIVEVEAKSKDNDKVYKKVEVINKDGSKTVTTELVDKSKSTSDTNINVDSEKSKETTYSKNTITINGLIGLGLQDRQPIYGISVSKQLLGPIQIGIWGLSNKTGGFSLGLSF